MGKDIVSVPVSPVRKGTLVRVRYSVFLEAGNCVQNHPPLFFFFFSSFESEEYIFLFFTN